MPFLLPSSLMSDSSFFHRTLVFDLFWSTLMDLVKHEVWFGSSDPVVGWVPLVAPLSDCLYSLEARGKVMKYLHADWEVAQQCGNHGETVHELLALAPRWLGNPWHHVVSVPGREMQQQRGCQRWGGGSHHAFFAVFSRGEECDGWYCIALFFWEGIYTTKQE